MTTKGKKENSKDGAGRKRADSEPKFPYTDFANPLRIFFKSIPEKPKPSKITKDTVKGWGIGNSNAQSATLRIARAIGFISPTGEPTELYTSFMDPNTGPQTLGQRLKEIYSPLFEASHEPHQETQDNLRRLFNIHSGGAERTIQCQLQTFKTLAEFASFTDSPIAGGHPAKGLAATNPAASSDLGTTTVRPAIHIDLHIHLPENKSARDYQYIFEDIARCLYGVPAKEENDGSVR